MTERSDIARRPFWLSILCCLGWACDALVDPGFSSLTIEAPPALAVRADGPGAPLQIRVGGSTPGSFPASLSILAAPKGLLVEPRLPLHVDGPGMHEIRIAAERDAEPGSWELRLLAQSGTERAETAVGIEIVPAEASPLVIQPAQLALRRGDRASVVVRAESYGPQETIRIAVGPVPNGLEVEPDSARTLLAADSMVFELTATATAPLGATELALHVNSTGPATADGGATLSVTVVDAVRPFQLGDTLGIEWVERGDTILMLVDAGRGGTLVDLRSNGRSLLRMDALYEGVQSHLFRGREFFDGCFGCTGSHGITWSSMQGGDEEGRTNPAAVAEVAGNTLHTRVEGVQWRNRSTPTFVRSGISVDQWIEPVEDAFGVFRIRKRFVNLSGAALRATYQHVPAIFPAVDLVEIARYEGSSPWTRGTLRRTPLDAATLDVPVRADEEWLAVLDESGYGLALLAETGFRAFRVNGEGRWLTPFGRFGFEALGEHDVSFLLGVGPVDSLRVAIEHHRMSGPPADVHAPLIHIDTPDTDAVLSGVVRVGGWAIDNQAIARIDVLLDGETVATASTGIARTDLLATYPFADPRSGFSVSFDSVEWPNGPHTLVVKAVDAEGNNFDVHRVIRFDNPGAGGPASRVVIHLGSPEVAIDYGAAGCGNYDIPDMTVSAVRSRSGGVITSGGWVPEVYLSRGASLLEAQRDCSAPVLVSARDSDPANYSYEEWIGPMYRTGDTIHAILHNEFYAPDDLNCRVAGGADPCWYNALTYAFSVDDGRTFVRPPVGSRLVAAPPERWVPEAGAIHYGYLQPSNIVRGKDDFLYTTFVAIPRLFDPYQYNCAARTRTLDDPASWRAWDGASFALIMANPYSTDQPEACAPVVGAEDVLISGLTYSTYLEEFVAVGIGTHFVEGRRVCGTWIARSSNMSHWHDWQLVDPDPGIVPQDCQITRPSLAYLTILDPDAAGDNFDRVDDEGYLFFTRMKAAPPDWELVRVPIRFERN